MEENVFRSGSILISNRRGHRWYGSADEVPPELRRPLRKAIENELATTIVIADKGGRPEALRRLRRMPRSPGS